MRIDFKKRKRSILENIFVYPSFSLRFWLYAFILFIVAGIPTLIIIPKISILADKLAGIDVVLQSVTLVFGVIATFFALRQLTESRFSKLDELAMQNLKSKEYFRAIGNWRGALYVKPDSGVFLNLIETLLTVEQFDEFDQFVGYLEKSVFFHRSFQQQIITEPKDYIVFCYLQTLRSLVVENMGVAKGHLKELTDFVKENKFQSSVGWDFRDIQSGGAYKKLIGDHKTVADNLIKYLSQQLDQDQKVKFESDNYLLT
jgi:hypothetical protein